MEEKSRASRVLNILLVIMILAIAILAASIFLIGSYRDTHLDLTAAYEAYDINDVNYSYGNTFATDLVASDASVTVDGVKLDSSTEKALLFDLDSRTPVFAQGIYDKAYPASITKLMTAILIIKYGNMSDSVTIIDEDLDLEEGSQVSGLRSGDIVSIDQLFHALVIYSGNDAAMAAARHIGGSVSAFVDMMNEEADRLGLLNTHFCNPHGLHDSDHYTCAYDVYLMMNEVIKYDVFVDAMTMNMYQLKVQRDGDVIAYNLDSTDKYMTGEKLMPNGISLLGGKTGTTDEAGACLALAVQDANGVPYIAVVLNAYNRSILYDDMNKLLGIIA